MNTENVNVSVAISTTCIDRCVVGIVCAGDVNPTPGDLGGVTSVLYELEHHV